MKGLHRAVSNAQLGHRSLGAFAITSLYLLRTFFPESINPLVGLFLALLLRSSSHHLAALSSALFLFFLPILSTLRLPGLGVLKQNCGFINKSKAAEAHTLHMSSGRHTKAVMYNSSSHSFCKQTDGQLAEANSRVLSSEQS